ncbi:phospho-N-acetylmuramoyl-pentapeptide-transferase [Collibacillus ludicampi]|jgi:phospho-N-acetylmuramoyl-pentapeptide-transferase|uniref:Phospho-N-acetylmuramoyl-pentapeptide-transferase n=1 Tax=Collibacillus ludicampi TaxID=2771369 RepID=A0AAV4LHY9_9BACL|nr:phospho-N-acetylmuramoyl-pentapeptide-transferase [Collibacillus ludicampi]GIM47450.1 phospho-N-acetylmuramoyl-pentapeptide-transferase [Collibacillus ludicampi]
MDMQTLFITTGVAFVVGVILGPLFIPILRKLKFGQAIRAEGPQAHQKKAGTPTMGGIIILVALTFTTLILSDRSWDVLLLLIVTLGYGLVGFLDDYIKVVMKRNLGLRAKQKLLGQILIGLIFFLILYLRGFDMSLDIPGIDVHWNLGLLYLPFLIFVVIGTSNAVNLTDGLDGLAAGTTAIAFGAYSIIALLGSKYDVSVFCAAMVGGVLAFLVFNAHPAKVFMGDTGSLAIGGALAAVAVLTKTEFLLVLIGGVFVVEALSVIIQVISFQTTGKRVFKMSPLHHHFELSGWSEWRVVGTFWAVGLFLSIGALALYMK